MVNIIWPIKPENISVSDMEALSDYLQGSQEIDDEGIVLDESGNILDD